MESELLSVAVVKVNKTFVLMAYRGIKGFRPIRDVFATFSSYFMN